MRLIDADALLEEMSIHLIRSGSVLFSNDVLTLITNAPTVQREHNKYCGGKIELAYGSTNCGSAFHGSIMKCDNCASEPTVQRVGWVSVPIEPTEEMIQAASNYWKKAPDNTYGFVLFENVYEVMIQAAPTDKE